MSDSIVYRKDVVEALYQALRTQLQGTFTDSMSLAISMAKALPSAEPKTGKWVYDKYYAVHVCSECDEQALEEYTVNPRTLDRDYDEVLSEYCPHCGSRMLEIEDEEEEEEEDDE